MQHQKKRPRPLGYRQGTLFWSHAPACDGNAAMQNDLDLGASGAVILADRQLVITGGKQGPIYLAQTSKLGGYDPAANNTNAYEVT